MIAVITIASIFLLAQLALLYAARRARLFVWAHATFYVTFVPVLHLLQYLSREDRPRFHLDAYALAHSTVFLYVVLFLLFAGMLMRFMPQDTTLIRSVIPISYNTLTGIFIAWVGLKIYLGIKYGALAFHILQGEIEGAAQFRLEFYDVFLSTYLTFLAVGACVAFALKGVIARAWPNPLQTGIFTMFLAIYLVLGEASIGARRFVLLITLVTVTGAVRAWQVEPERLMRKLSILAVTGLLIAVMFSVYFQMVRSNVIKSEISFSIASGDLLEMAGGALAALIPDIDPEIETELPVMLRTGPFELIYDILANQVETGATTRGRITTSSLEMIVPYVLAGPDKTSVNVDQILVDELGIIPSDGFVYGAVNIDLAGSLLAVFLADYGLIGALIAPIVTVVALLICSLMLRWAGTNTLLAVFALSALFQVVGNAEGDFLAVLAVIRDLFLGSMTIIGICTVTKFIGHIFRIDPKRTRLSSKHAQEITNL